MPSTPASNPRSRALMWARSLTASVPTTGLVLSVALSASVASAQSIPSGGRPSPRFGAQPFTQQLLLAEEFGTRPIPATGELPEGASFQIECGTSVARRVAGQMHFAEFKAEVLPHEKLEMVDALKAAGHRVAVIGDGVNDAPALAAGDVSIAMGAAGSDVAIHSASIALLNSNLNRIPFLVDLSRRTISVIRQNMVIGGLFIVVFMSLAGAGLVTPVMAALLHVVSGLAVVFNSARLVRCGEEIEQAEAGVSAHVS